MNRTTSILFGMAFVGLMGCSGAEGGEPDDAAPVPVTASDTEEETLPNDEGAPRTPSTPTAGPAGEGTTAGSPQPSSPSSSQPPSPQPSADPTVLARGTFARKNYGGSGGVQLVSTTAGGAVVRFGSDFKVDNGPTLHVYRTKHPSPSSAADVRGGFVDLGRLKKTTGAQQYAVDPGVDLAEYPGVIVYCAEYHVVFVAATLR